MVFVVVDALGSDTILGESGFLKLPYRSDGAQSTMSLLYHTQLIGMGCIGAAQKVWISLSQEDGLTSVPHEGYTELRDQRHHRHSKTLDS